MKIKRIKYSSHNKNTNIKNKYNNNKKQIKKLIKNRMMNRMNILQRKKCNKI